MEENYFYGRLRLVSEDTKKRMTDKYIEALDTQKLGLSVDFPLSRLIPKGSDLR